MSDVKVKMVRAEIDDEQYRDLRRVALDDGVPVQAVIGQALVEYLRKQGFASAETAEA